MQILLSMPLLSASHSSSQVFILTVVHAATLCQPISVFATPLLENNKILNAAMSTSVITATTFTVINK